MANIMASNIIMSMAYNFYKPVNTLCNYQCKAPLPYIQAAVGERWGMVGESTANLPLGSRDLSLYINLLN